MPPIFAPIGGSPLMYHIVRCRIVPILIQLVALANPVK